MKNKEPMKKDILYIIVLVGLVFCLIFVIRQKQGGVIEANTLSNIIDSLEVISHAQAVEIAYKDTFIASLLQAEKTQTNHLKKLQHENDSLRKIRFGDVPVYYSTLPIEIARERFIVLTNTNYR